MGLRILILGVAVFIASHIFVSFRRRRAALIARIGEFPYRLIFSLVAIVGLVLIAWGYSDYRAQGLIPLWDPPPYMRHVTVGLMFLSVVLLSAAFVPSHIRERAKHPMLASVKIWAFAHLLSNGDQGSLILFGSFLAWGVMARIAVKKRADYVLPAAPSGWGNDFLVLAVGTTVYLSLGYAFHPVVIGVPVFGG
jgi:uncharacterized membrane protein